MVSNKDKRYQYKAEFTEEGIYLHAILRDPKYVNTPTPEDAIDHLFAEMLMKASKLRLEAANLLQAVADFQELEKTNPKGE